MLIFGKSSLLPVLAQLLLLLNVSITFNLLHLATPTSAEALTQQSQPDHRTHVEDMLTKSLLNCPLCAGSEPCLRSCRTEPGSSWESCLHRCLGKNDPMTKMFVDMANRLSKKTAASDTNDATVNESDSSSTTVSTQSTVSQDTESESDSEDNSSDDSSSRIPGVQDVPIRKITSGDEDEREIL